MGCIPLNGQWNKRASCCRIKRIYSIHGDCGRSQTAANDFERHPDLFHKVSECFFLLDNIGGRNRLTGRLNGCCVFALRQIVIASKQFLFPFVCFGLCHLPCFCIRHARRRFPSRCAEMLFTLFVPPDMSQKLERNDLAILCFLCDCWHFERPFSSDFQMPVYPRIRKCLP